MREREIEQFLVNECKIIGWPCYKFTSPSRPGVPDRIVIGNGHTVFIELKRPNEEPTPLQMFHINRIRENGGDARWADTKEQVREILKDMANS